MDGKWVLISQNPHAGAKSGRPAVEQLAELLRREGARVEVMTDIDCLADEARKRQEAQQLHAVVAAGGDGTVALVANRTPLGTPIAVLPLGTENLLAKYLSLSADPEIACRTICGGTTIRLDAGKANERLFLLMASCGFDAEVVRRLHQDRKGHIHHLSYVKPILDSIRSYPYPEVRVCWDRVTTSPNGALPEQHNVSEDPWTSITARWVFVVNVPRYAGGLRIAPDARGTDGLLDVCTFKEGSLWNGLRYLSGVLLGQHQSWSDCVTVRTRRLRLESVEPVPYQQDGDPGGFLPLNIEVLPERLTLWVPRHVASAELPSGGRE
ncbi:MAG: diacylglycerol kinase family protein [Pirellulaceae bacterium]